MYGFRMKVRVSAGLTVLMRPYRMDEAERLVEGMSSYEVCCTLAMRGAQTPETERTWLEKMASQEGVHAWAICILERADDETGRPVGTSTLRYEGWRGQTGLAIFDRKAWGCGIAKATNQARTIYAFDKLDLMAIDSSVMCGNDGSLRALRNSGYEVVGRRYYEQAVDGEVRDLDELMVVNDRPEAWDYFWRGRKVPLEFEEARVRTREARVWVAENVTFL